MLPDWKGTPINLLCASIFLLRAGRGRSSSDVYSSCDLADSSCALDTLQGPTLIYTRGETRCINGDDYAFAVVPGDPANLLYYFQGGGACWEANTDNETKQYWHCTKSMQGAIATSGYGNGLQDRQHDKNPFRNYTVVNPLYCSGDVFMGSANMSGSTQRGYANNLAIIAWTKSHFPHRLSSFVIAGWSAGGLATRIWAETLLLSFSYQKATVLVDSQAGFLPLNSDHYTMERWGVCETSLVPADLLSSCHDNITIHDVYGHALARFSSVAFGTIQSKTDRTQIWFSEQFGQAWGDPGFKLAAEEYVKGVNRIVEEHSRYENYKAFLINSDRHCYLGSDVFWHASPNGPWEDQGSPLLYEWVSNLVSSGPNGTSSHCLEVLGDNLTKCPKLALRDPFLV